MRRWSGLAGSPRLPLCAGGSRVRARLYALIKAIRERRRKAIRVSRFAVRPPSPAPAFGNVTRALSFPPALDDRTKLD